MKTKKILATVAAFIVVATVLSAAVLATSLPSARPEVTPPAQTQAPANVIAPATPASAEKQTISEISDAEPVHRHASGDLEWMRAIDEQLRAYRQAEIARLECTHENSLLFCNTDTDITSAYCPDCGVIEVGVESTVTSLTTNAEIMSECSHSYTPWTYINTSVHRIMCTICSKTITEYHQIVEADCVTSKHCIICDGRDNSWEVAWGHQMEYVFDWSNFMAVPDEVSPEAYRHEYRCTRCDNDLEYICDYVVERELCTFTHIYWSPENNGVHERYQVCPFCEMMYFLEDSECPAAAYGTSCNMCNNPNKYNW